MSKQPKFDIYQDHQDAAGLWPVEHSLGVAEAHSAFGMTYDDDPESPRSRAYDLGRNYGEGSLDE